VSVKRRVDFFLARTAPDDDGTRDPYDISPSLAEIRALDWQDRYDVAEERILRLWPRSRGPAGMLGTVRRTALPPVDRGANIGDLGLRPGEGIVEQMFFKVYDERYVAVVRNQYGPRIRRLADYLDNLAGHVHPDVDFLPLARRDVAEQLREIKRLRKFKLKVIRPAVDQLGDTVDIIYDIAAPAIDASEEVDTFEVELSVGRRQGVSLGERWTRVTRRLARRDDLGEIATQFHVVFDDEDDERREINVLDDRISSSQEIETISERDARLSDRSAYRALDAAFEERADELEDAAGLDVEAE
jgi:hypothetical protein